MGNRLTLPLLLLAALLAGGAFFWMTGSERGGSSAGRAGPERVSAAAEDRPAAELEMPKLVSAEAKAPGVPARVELEEAHKATPAPKVKSPGAVSLRGQVVDRFGAPIAGARVLAAADTGLALDLELEREFPWMKRQRTETDAEGRFRFEAVDPGTLQLAVRAAGFAPHQQRGVAVPPTDTELEPIVVARGAILSGLVVDADGRPVGGARIVRAELDEGMPFFLAEREALAETGADGRFRVDQLACGAWRFVVRSEDHPDLTVEGLAEEPGIELGGLRWQLAPGAILAGTVTGIPEAERGLLEVRALRGEGGEHFLGFGAARVAKVESSGTFLLRGLDVGASYNLQARHARPESEHGYWERSRSESVQARAGDSGVVLSYRPEAALTFSVFDAATRAPLEHFEVESGIDWATPLRDEDGRPRKLFHGGVVRVGGLRPGSDQERVQLHVKATGYRDYERADIAVRAGQELDLGAIYLEPVPLVRVHVLDQRSGEPIANAHVRLEKEQGDAFQIRHSIEINADEGRESIDFGDGRTATTDARGWAEITSYEGETVELSARAKGYAPAKLGALALPRGKSVEHELRLTRGGEVLVRVLDARGEALAGVRVEQRASDAGSRGRIIMMGGPRPAGEITDSQGLVTFANLAAGVHSFRLADEPGAVGGFASMEGVVIGGSGGDEDEEWSQVQVVEGERSELVLRAAPRAGLAGLVREAGKILAGATLRLAKERPEGAEPRPMLPGMGGGPEAKSDGEGRYRIADVKEGRYTLTVEHPTRRMPQEFALELREGDNSFDVELALALVSGRVLDEQGKGLSGVRVWPERRAEEGGRQMRFRMIMMDDGGGGGVVDSGRFGERALTDADGRFTLRGVTSDVDLVVKAEGDSVQPGESQVVRVAPNESKEGVDFVLAPAGAIKVAANLADGSPARFQLVQATYLGDEQPAPEPKFGFLQQGSTELKGLKPGPWRVNVRNANDGPGGEGGGQDQEIEVEPGATATATFEVE